MNIFFLWPFRYIPITMPTRKSLASIFKGEQLFLSTLDLRIRDPKNVNNNFLIKDREGQWKYKWVKQIGNYGGTACQERKNEDKDAPLIGKFDKNNTNNDKLTCMTNGRGQVVLNNHIVDWRKDLAASINIIYTNGDIKNHRPPDMNLKAIVSSMLVDIYGNNGTTWEELTRKMPTEVYELMMLFLAMYHFPLGVEMKKDDTRKWVKKEDAKTIVEEVRGIYQTLSDDKTFAEMLIELNRYLNMCSDQWEMLSLGHKHDGSAIQRTESTPNTSARTWNWKNTLLTFLLLVPSAHTIPLDNINDQSVAGISAAAVHPAGKDVVGYSNSYGIATPTWEKIVKGVRKVGNMALRLLGCSDFNRISLPNMINSMSRLVELRDKTIPKTTGSDEVSILTKAVPALSPLSALAKDLSINIDHILDYLIFENIKAITEGRTEAEINIGFCERFGPFKYLNQEELDEYKEQANKLIKKGLVHPSPVPVEYQTMAKSLMVDVKWGTDDKDIYELIWKYLQFSQPVDDSSVSLYFQVRYLLPPIINRLQANVTREAVVESLRTNVLKLQPKKYLNDNILKDKGYIINTAIEDINGLTKTIWTDIEQELQDEYDACKTMKEEAIIKPGSDTKDGHENINQFIINFWIISSVITTLLLYKALIKKVAAAAEREREREAAAAEREREREAAAAAEREREVEREREAVERKWLEAAVAKANADKANADKEMAQQQQQLAAKAAVAAAERKRREAVAANVNAGAAEQKRAEAERVAAERQGREAAERVEAERKRAEAERKRREAAVAMAAPDVQKEKAVAQQRVEAAIIIVELREMIASNTTSSLVGISQLVERIKNMAQAI